MKKKFILFALILSVLCIGGGKINSLNAQNVVEIGEDQSPSANYQYNLPYYYNSAKSISQQIYVESDFNEITGTITSISFKTGDARAETTRQWEVYLKATDKNEFGINPNSENFRQFESLEGATKVYDGDVTIPNTIDTWFTIPFENNGFDYLGGNVVLCIYDKSEGANGWNNRRTFYAYSANARGIYKYTPDIDNLTAENATNATKVNQIRFTIQPTGPVLAKPTEVNASKINLYPGESTTISWTAADGATAYNVYVGNDRHNAEPITATEYVLSDLAYNVETGHKITVTAIHSEGESAKSDAVNVKMTAESNVTITVKNIEGMGIEGATVRLTNGQDQYGVAIEEQTFTTNENGQVVTNLLYLNNYYNYNMEVSKSSYITDNEQYISYSLLNNPTYTKEITLQLPALTGVTATKTQLYPGETTTISWPALDGATSYNVYVGNNKVAENIVSTEYTLSDLAYNMTGYSVTVTANLTLGETPKSEPKVIYMTAKSNVTITVKNAAGTSIEGATVRIYGGYDQYYKTIAEQIFTTNENGQIITELLYLYNYCNYSMEVSKSPYVTNNTDYMSYYYVNNGMYSKIITLSMSAPTNLVANDYSLYPDENVKLTWDAISGAQYNVYKRGAYSYETYNYEYTLLNTEGPLSEASFSFNAPEYNSSGYYYSVEAVYPEGVSSKVTLATPIKVTGYGIVSGMVTDGTNPIESAEVALVGTDEFGADKTYTFFTDEDGNYFSEEVLVGTYNVTASKIDYKSVTSTLNVVYGGELTYGDFTLEEKPEATISVTATQSGNNIVVSWEADYDKYNVYRRNVTTGNVETLATNVTEKEYTDTDWLNMGGATYQYGVSAKMNGETETVLNEGFENGSTPSGWSNTSNYYNYPIYFYEGYAHSGVYGAYLYAYGNYVYTLTTSEIDLTEYLSANLNFYYNIKNGYYGGNHILNVKVNVIGEDTWETIATINTVTIEYTLSENTLNKFAGKRIKIAFEFNTVSYAAAYLDDIVITGAPLSESKASWSTNLENENPLRFNNAAGDNKWNNTANWTCGVLPTLNKEVVIAAEAHINSEVNVMNLTLDGGMLRLHEGALLAVTGTFTDKNDTGWLYGGSVFIYDGAQLVQNNTKLKATFIMNIVNPSDEDMSNWANPEAMAHTGWQFIASPVANVGYSTLATYGDMYDLYKYDGLQENREWLNYKESAAPFGSYFEVGVGYLASHATKETISMLGTLNSATSHTYTVSYTEDNPLANFHLLGNPFSFDMDWDNVDLVNVYDGFATIDPATGGYVKSVVSGVTTIPVGDGFFVEAIGETPSISYPAQSKSRGEEKIDYINVIATGAEGSNNLIVKFSGAEEKGFSKLENINPNIADIYVKNNGRQYSILGYDQDVEEIEVFFAAKEMGNYSISFDINGNFENVVLVDRLTGIETNMLLEDEYTFVASSNDNPNRFVVRLDNSQQTTDNSHFAYVNNGDIVIYDIEGNANIIIFDAMGRCVYNGESSEMTARIANSFNAGVYVIQKVDDNGVKVQKVIID